MANQKNTKTVNTDSLLFFKRIMDDSKISSSAINHGKTNRIIRKPGNEMVDAVTKLIFHLEKGS